MIIYSDFQCPYCGLFARDTWPRLEKEFVETGRLQVAFRQLPLANHQFAEGAAEAAECAGEQGQFWQMHDLLFANQAKLDPASLKSAASSMKLDGNRFATCMDGAAALQVKTDVTSAKTLMVNSTPSFLLGVRETDGRVRVKQRFAGAKPYDQFRSLLQTFLTDQVQ